MRILCVVLGVALPPLALTAGLLGRVELSAILALAALQCWIFVRTAELLRATTRVSNAEAGGGPAFNATSDPFGRPAPSNPAIPPAGSPRQSMR